MVGSLLERLVRPPVGGIPVPAADAADPGAAGRVEGEAVEGEQGVLHREAG